MTSPEAKSQQSPQEELDIDEAIEYCEAELRAIAEEIEEVKERMLATVDDGQSISDKTYELLGQCLAKLNATEANLYLLRQLRALRRRFEQRTEPTAGEQEASLPLDLKLPVLGSNPATPEPDGDDELAALG